MEIKFEQIRAFGPSILKVSIPQQIIDSLNLYIDQIVSDKKKSEKLDHGKRLVADATQEFRIEKDFSKKSGWVDFLATCTREWIKRDMQKEITKFELIQTWVVRQFKHEFNPIHWHSGHISGVGYLKVPQNLGSSFQKEKKYNLNGSLNLIHGSRMFLNASYITIEPKVGDFYFFPHYLMHSVYPFTNTDEERRSVSFNATIDNEIFDVHKE
jgi:hypothetical protein